MSNVLQAQATILYNLGAYDECGYAQVLYDCGGKGYDNGTIDTALNNLIKAGLVAEKLNEPLEAGDDSYYTYAINA